MATEHQVMQALGELCQDVLGDGPEPAERTEQLRSFEALTRAPKPARSLRLAAFAAASLLVGGLTFVLLHLLSEPQIRFWVGNNEQPTEMGQHISAAQAPVDLRFDDQTQLELAPGTGAQVLQDDERSVRLVMGPGRVRARVEKKSRRRWTVQAGPYRVQVLGTRFSVDWREKNGCVDVQVERGRVKVSGQGIAEGGVELTAGAQLHRCMAHTDAAKTPTPPVPDEAVELKPVAAPEPVEAPGPKPSTAARPEAVAKPEPKADPAPIKVASLEGAEPVTWQDHLDLGQNERAVELAQEVGLDSILRQASTQDLWSLAEAARRMKRASMAERLLEGLRVRAPQSKEARLAAFLLGRLAMELSDKPAVAADWFATYTKENPAGELAEEALGRRMQALVAAGRTRQAKTQAGLYLQQYPDGMYALQAQQVITSE